MNEDRTFLTDWLLESTKPELLGDTLDAEELERMTVDELWKLAEERKEKLDKAAAKQMRERKALFEYGVATGVVDELKAARMKKADPSLK